MGRIHDKLSDAIDQGKITLGLFIDLSKALDTVNHDILLAKLEFYGVRGVALQWFKNYLSCRTQFVQYNGYNSSSKYIKCEVPHCFCYSSMTCVMCQRPWISYFLPMIPTFFFSHNDPNQLMEIVNNELKKLSRWFQANKLSINIKKILFYFI